MFKKLQWIGFATSYLIAVQAACAAINVNTASADALSGIKGISPAKAEAIIKERAAHGSYKNAEDLAKRVKGLGVKSIAKLQKEGLIVSTMTAQTASSKSKQIVVRERQ